MTMPELPPVILEAICVYQTLLLLGFRSERVFCGVHVSALTERKSIFVLLGPDDFSIEIGPCDLPDDEIRERWTAGTEAWNAADESVVRRIWDDSEVAKQVPMLAFAIRAKGIIVPAFAN